MDKNAIKKYAVWARRELIERVSQRALVYGITAKDAGDPNTESVNGHLLSQAEKRQRQALIRNIKEKGYGQVMEEVAYTWFNRFAALRFMEVNGYLPSHIRVFTNDAGEFKPQILAEAIHLELDGLDMNKVYELESANKSEELFKYLLIVQCNALNSILPGMFQRIEDYTELLLPDYLLREGSVIEQMVTTIPEDDWTDQVQIIGWLYQYYNTEPKDKVFADLKKNIKITKENIPAATQLFTPDWIVHYMVENSLGRLWLEGHPNDALKSEWKYYLNETEQEPEVQAQLATIRREYAALKPEEIRVIDPCMGSGHILCVLFDVLVRIYEDYGYAAREAAVKIVENNLWGLDIDERAAQLSYFAVMMKARQYDRRFFAHPVQPNVYAIQESDWIGGAFPFDMGDFLLSKEHQKTLNYLIDAFQDAKEYGSILQLEQRDYAGFIETWKLTASQTAENVGLLLWYDAIKDATPELAKIAIALTQQYHVVVTNPPYMAVSNAGAKVQDYVKKNYPDSKADLFAVFIERCGQMTGQNGYQAMITQHAWMFLSSFEKLRGKLLLTDTVNMAHLGARAFEEIGGEVVQTSSFVLRKSHTSGYKGVYCRLVEPTTQQGKEDMFLSCENRYTAAQDNFSKIPGSPVAYWVNENTLELFSQKRISDYFDSRVGLMTTDNDRYLRLFWEVDMCDICFSAHNDEESKASGKVWFPHNKGGAYRKWAGNREYVVDWKNNGEHIKRTAIKKYPYLNGNPNFVVHDDGFYFHENVSWSEIAVGNLAFRYYPDGFTFNVKGMSTFPKSSVSLYAVLGFANTKVATYLGHILNPSISFGVNSFGNLPFVLADEIVEKLAKENVELSTNDWDSFETSWDFQQHPLVALRGNYEEAEVTLYQDDLIDGIVPVEFSPVSPPIQQAYEAWERLCDKRFDTLKANEEELNRIFIDIYGLQDELTSEVEDKDVTVRRADVGRDIRSFISYAVGCMFGRYSLYKNGLIFAGEPYSLDAWVEKMNDQPGIVSKAEIQRAYKNEGVVVNEMFFPDKDNIIPICDDEYFEDDIVGRFVKFVETVYGTDTLDENLKFIADALGGSGQPKDVIRNYFLNGFYADHLKVYQKRPIYWLFDSGKKNGFKCLIYMHRYQPDTIARIRTDYVHEQQSRYRTAIADLEQRINGAATSERVKLSKQLAKLQAQAEEIRVYEEKIHHLADQMIKIDLDDGVKHNYDLFRDVLAKIK